MSDRITSTRFPAVSFAEFSAVMEKAAPWWNDSADSAHRMVWASFCADASAVGGMRLEEFTDGIDSFEHATAFLMTMAAGDTDEGKEEEYFNRLRKWLEEQGKPEEANGQAPAAPDADETAAQAAQLAEKNSAAQDEARKAAQATLSACVSAYRRGEREYRKGLLESGRLASEYIAQRLALGDGRKGAVQAIEGALAAVSSTAVDANELIRSYHAFRLLAQPILDRSTDDDKDSKARRSAVEAVPYGTYRDCYSLLVDRVNKETAEEGYVLLPGFEAHAEALFATNTANKINRAGVTTSVKNLIRVYLDKRAADTKSAAEAVKLAAEKARERVQDAADLADIAETPEEKQAALKAVSAADEEAKAKEREAAKLQREAETAQKKADKANDTDKPVPATVKGADKVENKAPTVHVEGNLLASAKQATTKDAGEMAAEFVMSTQEPDAVVLEMLERLSASKKLSVKTRRGIDAAILIMTREDSKAAPSPVAVAQALQGNASQPLATVAK